MRATDLKVRSSQRGFGYLVLLLGIVIGGILLSALSSHWAFESRRQREEEFVFRAEQYRDAIQSYASAINVNGCSNVQQLPAKLADLVEDQRCGMVRHHLRRLYLDPITRSQEWGLIREFGAIQGVYSQSTRPIVRHVDGVKKYFEWKFVADVGNASGVALTRSNQPGSTERLLADH